MWDEFQLQIAQQVEDPEYMELQGKNAKATPVLSNRGLPPTTGPCTPVPPPGNPSYMRGEGAAGVLNRRMMQIQKLKRRRTRSVLETAVSHAIANAGELETSE